MSVGSVDRDAAVGAAAEREPEIATARPGNSPSPKAIAPLPVRLYRGFARFPGPMIARAVIRRRLARGKEDAARVDERFGRTATPRPAGPLVWLHAVSVGEALSALPLIERLRARRPDLTVLLTTTTTTSAALLPSRLPPGVIHQFAPIDTRAATTAFLDHWRPDLFGVLEAEIWPMMIEGARARTPRMAMISACISEGSSQRWARLPRSIAWLLGRFDAVLAQDEANAARFAALGADPARLSAPGALKSAAAPLPVDEAERAALEARLSDRPLWLAASTHPGEETAAFAAHARLAARRPDWLTLIAPRHPERADAVAAEAEAAGLRVARRSERAAPGPETDVFLIDRLGELGLWYRLVPLAFIGGSLDPAIGGHNLREAARLGPAVLHGPHLANFEPDRARLQAVSGARQLARTETLADALDAAIGADGAPLPEIRAMAARGAEAMADGGAVLERIWAAVEPLLPAPEPAPEPASAPAPTPATER